MFIRTEDTPNPNSLKFIPGVDVLGNNHEPVFFKNEESTSISPLAGKLFSLPFVKNIMLGSDFITVTKDEDFTWESIKPDILIIIMEFFITGMSVLQKKNNIDISEEKTESESEDSPIVKEIKELIETRVRPAVAQDGGDITFYDFKDGIVYVILRGSCSGCPSSSVTLKQGIESMLQHYVPEVIAVEQVEDY
jgi:NFU1 iron-sulfur cluster scaffold homolog, mitochondrial